MESDFFQGVTIRTKLALPALVPPAIAAYGNSTISKIDGEGMTTSDDKAIAGTAYRVGSLAALEAGETVLTEANGTEVALFLCKGQVVVTQGQCPHAGGPLHEGEVDGAILTCPWHGWTFDLTTGDCPEDELMHLARYPARVDGDDIFVIL